MQYSGQYHELKGLQKILARIPFDLGKTNSAMWTSMDAASAFAQGQLIKRIPVTSGQTRGRISYKLSKQPDGLHGEVGGKSISAGGFNILKGLEEGTGLYGPFKQRIYPKNAKVLRWASVKYRPGGSGGGARAQTTILFARSIAGMVARRPFARTKEEAGKQIQSVFIKRFAQEFHKFGNIL